MSSQLNSFVPVLDGTNYQQWASAMQSFLMSQGQWKCAKEGANPPTVKTDGEVTMGQDELDKWNQDSEKAVGNIRLRLHHTIGYQFNSQEDPSKLWTPLKEKYGAPGIPKAFIEFKGAMDMAIPNGSDPSLALDKIISHFVRLKTINWEIPAKVQAMMIMSKAPPSMESVVQLFSQMLADVPDKEKEASMNPEKICAAFRTSWETHGRQGAKGKQNQQQAQKLSAVKQNTGPPTFQQQHQPQQQQRG